MNTDQFKTEIKAQTVAAMKQKDQLRTDTLRSITNAITFQEKNNPGKEINHIDVLSTMAKQRTQSIDAYTAGGNLQAAEDERKELEVINEFLPKTMNDAELENAVTQIIKSMKTTLTIREMGKVVASFRSQYPGQDMGKVSQIVKYRLS